MRRVTGKAFAQVRHRKWLGKIGARNIDAQLAHFNVLKKRWNALFSEYSAELRIISRRGYALPEERWLIESIRNATDVIVKSAQGTIAEITEFNAGRNHRREINSMKKIIREGNMLDEKYREKL